MATARPFGYNPSKITISGTTQLVDLSIGIPKVPTGITFWNGPNEDLGYIICEPFPAGNHPTPVGNIGTVRFFRSPKTDTDFINMVNGLYNKTFDTGNTLTAVTWLNNTGYWTSFIASGSILFSGNTSSYITINNDIDLRFRTGDFTVEWWQYQIDNNSFPRPWTLGSWPNSNIGVSLESGNFLFWYDGSTGQNIYYTFGNLGSYKNQWIHLAISRSGSTVRAFKNGAQIGSDFTLSYDFNDSSSIFCIGGEPNHAYETATFGGNITNFRWIKGSALYTSDFSVPTSPLAATNETKILILASNNSNAYIDSSASNKTINHTGTTWSSMSPYL